MEKQLNLADFKSPCGILHDKKLHSISEENGILTLTFEIHLAKEDYSPEVYENYKDFSLCKMQISLAPTGFHEVQFESAVRRNGKFKGISVSLPVGIEILRNATEVNFLSMATAENSLHLNLYASFYDAKRKYKKYNRYSGCSMVLNATEARWIYLT